jgi:hypothetical protein
VRSREYWQRWVAGVMAENLPARRRAALLAEVQPGGSYHGHVMSGKDLIGGPLVRKGCRKFF